MRVPRSWLRELVEVDVPTEELADRLSMTGTAVEAIDRFADGVSGIVAGRVLEVADVPESEKLCIAQVDVGAQRVQVLAGAKNFTAQDIVPVALPGARVTTLDVPVERRRMVSGKYESQGMLCSAKELGVADEHAGILVLPEDSPVGSDVAELLGLNDDVLEFEIYPNRPDLMSVTGIAREVALLYGVALRPPSTAVVEDGPAADGLTSVDVEDPHGCPRYTARVITDVRFGPSPPLVQARLSACGLRPLGNLVDATNYVLLLTGQPLHAFDLDALAERRIVVRRARDGEALTTIDGQERRLDADDLVIADAERPQAIAGVMGGEGSEVGEGTRTVLLETATFDPISVARTSRRHQLRSEASARFERGTDPEGVLDAAALCAELIRATSGGTVATGVVDAGSPPPARTVPLRPGRITTILGMDVPAPERDGYLEGLGCRFRPDGEALAVDVPSWRPDLEREIDLIEEVARLHGYQRIPAVERTGPGGGRTVRQVLRERVRQALLGCGVNEARLSTFVAAEDLAAFGYDGELVQVSNPVTEDQRRLRPTVFPNLLRAAQRNLARGRSSVRLFEIGKIFLGWQESSELPEEREHVGVVLAGELREHWSAPARVPDAFDVKGILEVVLREVGVRDWSVERHDGMPGHPGRSASVLAGGTLIGRFGELRPSVAKAFGLEAAVIGGLALEPVFALAPEELKVRPPANLPPVLRDISMWLPEAATAGAVIETMRAAGGPLLEDVRVLDEYRPEVGPEGGLEGQERRSVAFGLVFRAPDRTLRAEEADAAREAIAAACRERLGAEIR